MGLEATGALTMSGSGGPLGGQPYAGAIDRLIAIHRKAVAPDIRQRALAGMLSVSSARARALDYLRDVAESGDSTAYDAVEFLITDAGGGSWGGVRPTTVQQQESVATLKELVARRRVTTRMAAHLLDGWFATFQSRNPSGSQS